MGLILAIIIGVGTILIALLIVFADSMSDAPSAEGISPVPVLVIGLGAAGVLAFTHFYPIHLGW